MSVILQRVTAAAVALAAISCSQPAESRDDPVSAAEATAAAKKAAAAVEANADAAQAEVTQSGVIWTGTLGTMPITACFEDRYTADGIYYYNRHLVPLRLVVIDESEPSVLAEVEGFSERNGSSWTIDSRSDDRISATWRKGNRTLPIRLSDVPVTFGEFGSVCESAAFVEPLIAGGTTSETRVNFEGLAYTKREYNGPERLGDGDYYVASFALDPQQPGDAAINRSLAELLPDGSVDHAMGQCVGMSMAGGQLGYLTETFEPSHVSDGWLGVEQAGSTYCGGAHPSHYMSYAIYNRTTGEEADPSTWFKPEALEFYEFLTRADWDTKRPIAGLSAPLLDTVLAHWPQDEDREDCADAARSGTGWSIGLSGDGVIFLREFPHVIFACTESVVVPWDELEPFLSKEGRAVAASF